MAIFYILCTKMMGIYFIFYFFIFSHGYQSLSFGRIWVAFRKAFFAGLVFKKTGKLRIEIEKQKNGKWINEILKYWKTLKERKSWKKWTENFLSKFLNFRIFFPSFWISELKYRKQRNHRNTEVRNVWNGRKNRNYCSWNSWNTEK